MALEITIQENDKKVNIKVDNAEVNVVSGAINKAFLMFGVELYEPQKKDDLSLSPNISMDAKILKCASGDTSTALEKEGTGIEQAGNEAIEYKHGRPKQLPLAINGKHDTFKPKDTNVQVSYVCPECGDEGHLHAYLGNRYTKCPTCKTKMFNEQATDVAGAPDPDGNVYFASKRYLTPRERFEYKQIKL